ncbi:MFS general substrate transporter [Hymenopellis radicata]|nr:MFS general substrate transporter [Hymenopellis radicata]
MAIRLPFTRSKANTDTHSDGDQDAEKVSVDTPPASPDVNDQWQDDGVTKIEALYIVFGRGWKLWALWGSIALLNYVYTLSSGTTYTYVQYATSSFSKHTILGTISVATAIITGVSKPFIAKLADLTSRPLAISVMVVLYVVGYIVIASSTTVEAVCAGEVIYTPGSTGIDFLAGIIVADITSLQWRALINNLVSSIPWLINVFISTYITTGIAANTADGWRWGFGMFAILIPVSVTPAIWVLFWGDRRAKKLGALSLASSSYERRKQLSGNQDEEQRSLLRLVVHYWKAIDAFGLILLGTSFALFLLPFTLYTTASKGFKNPSLIAMFVVGGIMFIAFCSWELLVASHPIMPRRVLNRSLICSIVIDFTYYLSGYISGTYFQSWVYVITDWSFTNYTYYSYTQTLVLCFFGIVAGAIQRYTHRYKFLQLFGLALRCVGLGVQYLASTGQQSTAVLVLSLVIPSIGGAFSVVGSQIATQASVPHQDMALAMALLSLWTSIGGSIGSAISAAVWNDMVPRKLNQYLGDVKNSTELAEIFGSIVVARTTEPRELVIQAYSEAVRPLFLGALIVSFVPLLAGCLTTNFYLGTQHNAIENKEVVIRSEEETKEEFIKAQLEAKEKN